MLLETLLLVFAASALAVYEHRRRRRQEFHQNRHQDELVCIVAFHDRERTLPLIDGYFDEKGISVLDLSKNRDSIGEKALYTHTYRLHLPYTVDQSGVVGRLSGIDTVQSVQIRPM